MLNKNIITILCLLPVAIFAQVKPDGSNTAPATSVLPVPGSYNSSIKINYVRSWDVNIPIINETDVLSLSRTVAEVKQTTQYFDGLGRPLQTISKQATPSYKDIVVPVVYDAFGRESVKYLPYVALTGNMSDGNFKSDPFNAQAAFYSNAQLNPAIAGEQVFYSRTTFDESPLNRVIKSMSAGNSWAGNNRGINASFEFNEAGEVRKWTVDMNIGSIPSSTGYYNANELFRTVTTDEHGKHVIEYKDKDGAVILKKVEISLTAANKTSHQGWLCTYYVYDDLNKLRFVIPPKAVEAVVAGGTIPADITSELCFRYEYDDIGRMIIKKIPGAGEVHLVYDERDRLIMTQDAKMRSAGKWMVLQYDELNRPTKTYLWNNTQSRSVHEANAVAINYPSLSGTYVLLSENFYDNYSWVPSNINGISSSLDNSYVSSMISAYNTAPYYAQQIVQSAKTKGLATGTKINILGTNDYIYTVSFYDDKGRVVQVRSTNIAGGYDIVTTQYDFSSKPLRTHQLHKNPAVNSDVQVATRLEYDHAGRLLKVFKKVNGQQEVAIARNEYDELGQLKIKKLGQKRDPNSGNYTDEPMETLNYAYNIRGWLTSINKDFVEENASKKNWFGMTLSYDHGFTQNQYNGNIGGTKWKSRGSGMQRAYGFNYDNANRLLAADFTEDNAGDWNTTSGIDFSMTMGDGVNASSAYDANGNILKMWQKGWKITGSVVIDDLNYSYFNNSNKLRSVSDPASATASGLGDFTDKNTTNDDYDYDVNGNLSYDKNKDIASIEYNHLNLPSVITFSPPVGGAGGGGVITYTYDAAGNKLRKTTVDNTVSPAKTTVTDYIAGFVYEKVNADPCVLQFIAHEEGRIRPDATQVGGFAYDYFIKDHLGNVRMMLTDEIAQRLYLATLEGDKLQQEQQLFTSLNDIPKPSTFDAETANEKVDRVNATSTQTVVGAGLLLKVMAGDKINASVFARYNKNQVSTDPGDNKQIAQQIADAMSAGFSKQFGMHGQTIEYAASNNWLSGILNFLTSKSTEQPNTDNTLAHLNWILLDEEQLKLVSDNSGFQRVPRIEITDEKQLVQAEEGEDIEVTRNGYIYVFVSNSANIPMFFDDLRVMHTPGPLLEETHYYPFGLTMAGISSKAAAFNNPNNKIKFQNQEFATKEFSDGSGLDIYEFKWRMHDPQTGRFWQIDPLANEYVYNSTYAFSENKVTAYIELEGLEAVSAGKPEAYLQEGFRQIFQAIGSLFTFKSECHFSYDNEKKTEIKTPVASVENTATVTLFEFKAEICSNFENYFKYGGGKLFEPKLEINTGTKVENTTSATVKTSGAPVKMSTKTTVDQNGTSKTVSFGTGASVDAGKVNANISATGFVTNQQSGFNAGQYSGGIKISADATFVSKKTEVVKSPFVKVTTSSNIRVGGSIAFEFFKLFLW